LFFCCVLFLIKNPRHDSLLLGSLNMEIFVCCREEPKTFPEFKEAGWTPGICSAPRGSQDKLPSLDPDLHFQNKHTQTFRMFK